MPVLKMVVAVTLFASMRLDWPLATMPAPLSEQLFDRMRQLPLPVIPLPLPYTLQPETTPPCVPAMPALVLATATQPVTRALAPTEIPAAPFEIAWLSLIWQLSAPTIPASPFPCAMQLSTTPLRSTPMPRV